MVFVSFFQNNNGLFWHHLLPFILFLLLVSTNKLCLLIIFHISLCLMLSFVFLVLFCELSFALSLVIYCLSHHFYRIYHLIGQILGCFSSIFLQMQPYWHLDKPGVTCPLGCDMSHSPILPHTWRLQSSDCRESHRILEIIYNSC